MRTTDANIEICRANNVLQSISLIMPVWHKCNEDGFIEIHMPLFGLKTIASNEEAIEKAVTEAVHCFAISAEKFGKGLEFELQMLGWQSADEEESLLQFIAPNDVFQQVIETGDPISLAKIEFSAAA